MKRLFSTLLGLFLVATTVGATDFSTYDYLDYHTYGSAFGGSSSGTGLTFYTPLTDTLTLLTPPRAYPGTTGTFTRASSQNVYDHENILRPVASGSIDITGSRMVTNLLTYPEDLSNAAWSKGGTCAVTGTNTVNTPNTFDRISESLSGHTYGDTYRLSAVLSGSGTISLRIMASSGSSPSTKQITLTDTPTRYSHIATINENPAGIIVVYAAYRNTGDTATQVTINKVQFERVNSQSNQNPSEYVKTTSAPVTKCFSTLNGNTVNANGVVTEATGAALTTVKGPLFEPASTNLCLQSQAAETTWTQTNITIASNSIVAPDGSTTADTLTASADNATWVQTPTATTAVPKNWALWIKRKTGTGTISMSLDGGSTYTAKTITTSWARYDITQTIAAHSLVLKIATSGDAIYVWQSDLTAASVPSSPIYTTTATVTRAATSLSFPVTGNFGIPASIKFNYISNTPVVAGEKYLLGSYADANNSFSIIHDGTNNLLIFRKRVSGTDYDASIAFTPAAGTANAIGARINPDYTHDIFLDKVKGTSSADTTPPAAVTTDFRPGDDGNGSNGVISSQINNFYIYKRKLPDSLMYLDMKYRTADSYFMEVAA